MDILRTNFPGALSRTTPQPNSEHQRNPSTPQMPTLGWTDADTEIRATEGASHEGERHAVGIPLIDQAKRALPQQLSSGQISQMLLTKLHLIGLVIVASDDPRYVEYARASLDVELDKLRQVHSDPAFFATRDERSWVFRSAAIELRKINKYNNMRKEMEKAICRFEASSPIRNPSELQSLALIGSFTYPWSKRCLNSIPFPSVEKRQEALRGGHVLLTCEQLLPQGGYLIMQKWREEMEKIINPMLEGVEEEARRVVIEQQRADMVSTHQFLRDVQGYRKDIVGPDLIQPTVVLYDIYHSSMEDHMSAIAAFACRLERAGAVRLSQLYVRMKWQKFLSVRGMRMENPKTWHAGTL